MIDFDKINKDISDNIDNPEKIAEVVNSLKNDVLAYEEQNIDLRKQNVKLLLEKGASQVTEVEKPKKREFSDLIKDGKLF